MVAHPDDEILGSGGYLSKLIKSGEEVLCIFMADGESSRYLKKETNSKHVRERIEFRRKAALDVAKFLGTKPPIFLEYRDNAMDEYPLLDVVKDLEFLIDKFEPDRIITHFPGDINVDHQVVSKAVVTASRPLPGCKIREILFIETLSSTEYASDLKFNPNFFVNINVELPTKIHSLEFYKSELQDFPHPRSIEGVINLSKYRGSSVGLEHVEAFEIFRYVQI